MSAINGRTAEQRMKDALRPFGWTCGPEFWRRYHSDPWVFNLANAVEALSERLSENGSEMCPECGYWHGGLVCQAPHENGSQQGGDDG